MASGVALQQQRPRSAALAGERRRGRGAAAELDVARQLARSGCSQAVLLPGTTVGSPVIARAASMPEMTAASTQPPSIPLRVQSPASSRLAKPESPERQAVLDRAGGREHVALRARCWRASTGSRSAAGRSPFVAVDQRRPSRTRRRPRAPSARAPRGRARRTRSRSAWRGRSAASWASPARLVEHAAEVADRLRAVGRRQASRGSRWRHVAVGVERLDVAAGDRVLVELPAEVGGRAVGPELERLGADRDRGVDPAREALVRVRSGRAQMVSARRPGCRARPRRSPSPRSSSAAGRPSGLSSASKSTPCARAASSCSRRGSLGQQRRPLTHCSGSYSPRRARST